MRPGLGFKRTKQDARIYTLVAEQKRGVRRYVCGTRANAFPFSVPEREQACKSKNTAPAWNSRAHTIKIKLRRGKQITTEGLSVCVEKGDANLRAQNPKEAINQGSSDPPSWRRPLFLVGLRERTETKKKKGSTERIVVIVLRRLPLPLKPVVLEGSFFRSFCGLSH